MIRCTTPIYNNWLCKMAKTLNSMGLNENLADKVLEAKSHTEAVVVAPREIVALRRFKKLMKKNAGKLAFANHNW